MKRVASVIFAVSLMLFILAVVVICISVKGLFAILPADSYEDNGTHIFEPYKVLPHQVKNTFTYSRDRRMNPTKTVYMVHYRTTDGSGYKWSNRAITRELGWETVEEGIPVTRRVLSIPGENTYITVKPEQTVESYIAGLWQKYVLALALSAAYILIYLVIWGVILSKRRR